MLHFTLICVDIFDGDNTIYLFCLYLIHNVAFFVDIIDSDKMIYLVLTVIHGIVF